jgi:hypothetical protein
MRKSAIDGQKFDENFKHAEDYDIWERISGSTEFSNMAERLLVLRKHDKSISQKFSKIQIDNSNRIRKRALEKIAIIPTDEELDVHSTIRPLDTSFQKEFLGKLESWLQKIKKANDGIGFYDKEALDKILQDRWLLACSANSDLGLWAYSKYKNSKIYSSIYFFQSLKLFIKCLIASFKDSVIKPVK